MKYIVKRIRGDDTSSEYNARSLDSEFEKLLNNPPTGYKLDSWTYNPVKINKACRDYIIVFKQK